MNHPKPPLAASMLMMAMAGGMGWGIRGQYGHETGAMIAGVLVGSVVALFYCRRFDSLAAARVIAMFTLGVSVGGSMTYGQTLGLTQDPTLIGNLQAWRHGIIGVFLKGGIWISFAAAWMATQLSRTKYHAAELLVLLIAALLAWFLGVYFLNEPFDPEHRLLPRIYFSDHWRWGPESVDRPRREVWGGLLLALIAVVSYGRCVRSDRLVLRLAIWGFVAGGVGFSCGQMIQSAYAWNPDAVTRLLPFPDVIPLINWWNMMEITFGMLFGAILAVGISWNYFLIEPPNDGQDVANTWFSPAHEVGLLLLHAAAVAMWNLGSFDRLDAVADIGLTMIWIPTFAVLAGRYWPYWLTLPMVLLPIGAKTAREVCAAAEPMSRLSAGLLYILLPAALALALATWLARQSSQQPSVRMAAITLLFSAAVFFSLNSVMFEFAWPWAPWTNRTPSMLINLVQFAILIVGTAWWIRKHK